MQAEDTNNETKIEAFIAAGQIEKATELLYQLAVECAKNKAFTKSEAYRDRLYEIDSMSLSRIVELNEIIEDEKSNALTLDDRRLWSIFFEQLTAEESNAFFFALKEREFDSETVILKQGQHSDRLYLVSQGQLKQTYDSPHKEVLINQLGSGEFFGEDTFFSVNVCTVSVKVLNRCRLRVLDRSDLEKLKKMHTSLESNLEKICMSKRSVFDRLQQKGLDRRHFKRIAFNTNVLFQVLSESDRPIRSAVAAELWDISKGGLSFYFHSKSQESVRRLIGRSLGVRFQLTISGETKAYTVTGVVHGVQSHPMEEYSVHMKLNRRFTDKAIKTIQSMGLNSRPQQRK
jgi:CRP-like cAMP-binding protein